MPEISDHRARILASIRVSLNKGMSPAQAEANIAAECANLDRKYVRTGTRATAGHDGLLELLTDRLLEYDAGVYRAAPEGIAAAVGEILAGRGKRGLAIPAGVPAEWLPQGYEFTLAEGFDAYQLDATEGVLTGCSVAIAETGSIVLQNAAAQGARILSLVPDYHLCVVFAGQIVEEVPEAFAGLKATSTLPTTFISGPSATADIEMTRIKGVHGPRFLDVLLVV